MWKVGAIIIGCILFVGYFEDPAYSAERSIDSQMNDMKVQIFLENMDNDQKLKVPGGIEYDWEESKFQPGVIKIGVEKATGHTLYCIKNRLYDDSGFLGMYSKRNDFCGTQFDNINIKDGGVNLEQ